MAHRFILNSLHGRQDDTNVSGSGDRYQSQLRFITTDVHQVREHRVYNVLVIEDCDYLQDLVAVVHNPTRRPIGELISRIQLTIGGTRTDQLGDGDGSFEEEININCALFGDTVRQISDNTYIPLHMCPFHKNSIFPVLEHHHMIFIVDGDVNADLKFAANFIFVKGDYAFPQKLLSVQSANYGAEIMRPGLNTFKLNYAHPIYAICFWGFDKTNITNVKLVLGKINDVGNKTLHTYFDGDLSLLEYAKAQAGFDTPVCMFIFSTEFKQTPMAMKATINGSQCDYMALELTTTNTAECKFNCKAFTSQVITAKHGMIGLEFSK